MQKYLMTAANGMQVWVPEDKLEQWQKAQADQSDEAKQAREALVAAMLRKMDQLSSDTSLNVSAPGEEAESQQADSCEVPHIAEKSNSDLCPSSEPRPVIQTQKKKYCKKCGNLIDPTTSRCTQCLKQYFTIRNKWFVASLVLTFLLLCTLVAGFFLFKKYQNLTNAAKESLQTQLTAAKNPMKR